MASSTQCFLSHPTFTTPTRTTKLSSQRQVVVVNTKPNQLIVCKTQNQKQLIHEDDCSNIISRRLALTVLIGSAAVGSRVSPADAAYGESGILLSHPAYLSLFHDLFSTDTYENGHILLVLDTDTILTLVTCYVQFIHFSDYCRCYYYWCWCRVRHLCPACIIRDNKIRSEGIMV